MADKSITAANVLQSSSGQVTTAVAAVAVTRGQFIYKLTNGTVGLADANGASPANTIEGCALADVAAGQTLLYCKTDTSFTPGFTGTAGDRVYLSGTAGGCTTASADLASGMTVIVLGIMLTSSTMIFTPVTGGAIP